MTWRSWVGQAVWQEGPEQEGGAHERARHQQRARVRGGEAHPGEREDEAREHDDPGRRDERDERDGGGAPEACAREVGEVEAVEALGPSREDRRQGEPGGEEGREETRADERELGALAEDHAEVERPQALDHVERVQLRASDYQVAAEHGGSGGQAADRDEARRRHAPQVREERDQCGARADAEHREADDEVGEVIDELEGEDAGVAHLERMTARETRRISA